MTWRSKSRNFVFVLLDVLGINELTRSFYAKKAIILWYHGISNDDFTLLKGYDERHIPKSLFKKHLEYLCQKGYAFTTMSQLIKRLKNKEDVSKNVVLTFDDGFRNVIENAYPMMKEFQAKGCVYLVSDLVTKQGLLWTDFVEMVVRTHKAQDFFFVFKGETLQYDLDSKTAMETAIKDIKKKLRSISDTQRREHLKQFHLTDDQITAAPKEFQMANWQEIQELDKTILEVGSHTRTHPNCANLTTEGEMQAELNGSKTDIESKVGYPVVNFCYPAGSFDERVIDYVQKAGYASATTIISGFNDAQTPLHQLRRIATDENFWFFKSMVSGSFYMISDFKKLLRGRR